MFVLMAKVPELQTMMMEFPAPDSEGIFKQTQILGEDFGLLMRVFTGYHE